jgi:Flp pilus assembly protein TadG
MRDTSADSSQDTLVSTRKRRRAGTRRTMAGVALIEAALTIPLILLFIGGIVDLGRLVVRYVAASRFAYEGARFTSQLPGVLNTDSEANCATYTSNSTQSHSVMGQLCNRIKVMMDNSGYTYDTESAGIVLTVSSEEPPEFNLDAPSYPPAKSVTVRVGLTWEPLLLTFLKNPGASSESSGNVGQGGAGTSRINSSVTAPYIMPDSTPSNPSGSQEQ